jgi:hypothetical protein
VQRACDNPPRGRPPTRQVRHQGARSSECVLRVCDCALARPLRGLWTPPGWAVLPSHPLLEGQRLISPSISPSHPLLVGQRAPRLCITVSLSPAPGRTVPPLYITASSHLLLEGQRLYCTSPSLSHLLLEGQRPYCTSPSLSHLLLEGQCLHARDDRELDAGALDCAAHHLARQEMREEHGARLGIIGRSSVPSNELFVEITSGDSTYQYSY